MLPQINHVAQGPSDPFYPRISVGTIIGRYRVLAYAATGGQSRVYKAFDLFLDRLVGLKEIPRSALLSLVEEYLLLQRCQESGIVPQPYEILEEPLGLFLVMEWVEGTSLIDYLNQAQMLPLTAVLPLLIQCGEALEQLHQRQILHRDIKPDNILVTPTRRIVFLDLGISVLARPGPDGMTRVLRGIGTSGYMAPEQVHGSTCPASDVYSLGRTFSPLISKAAGSRREVSQLHELVFAMTDPLPCRRPTLADINTVLHAISKKGDTDE